MTPAPKNALPAPESGVTVRMYNPGFGDCLLLAFRADDGTPRYLLVDCGVHHQYDGGAERCQLVADDIARVTDNHLHVVAITHEHTDHLLGFRHARSTFDQMAIDDLWLAWTEDPRDSLAVKLKELYGKKTKAAKKAAAHLQALDHPLGAGLQAVLDFECPGALTAAAGKPTELQYLRDRCARKLRAARDYCRPGQPPLTIPDVSGVRVYVLGPPHDEKSIKTPEQADEMYPELAASGEQAGLIAALLGAAGEGTAAGDGRPFVPSPSVEMTPAQAAKDGRYSHFFREHYGFSDREGHGPAWRRIDSDWLAAAGELALSINSYTNNTSLVLAIELTETDPRKVLLFAGDAQIGNWLSWGKLEWPHLGKDGATVAGEDLLGRTVLYKVGHHGSQNATAKTHGLELMEGADLVGMIPVDQKWALDKQGWHHPCQKLEERLREKTDGRVLRSDRELAGNCPPNAPTGMSAADWKALSKQHVAWDTSGDKLWVQCQVAGQFAVA